MEELLKKIVDSIGELKEGQQEIHENQVRMEFKMDEKFGALFDAREQQLDINKEIIEKLDRIEAKVDVLQLETAHIRRIK
jgi:hypothetical protein